MASTVLYKVMSNDCDTEGKLYMHMETLFEHAVENSVEAEMVAKTCKKVQMKKVIHDGSEMEYITFRTLLIKHCQGEFEKDYKGSIELDNRNFGIVNFIGELFKQELVTSRIIHECIKVLLNKNSEASLKCALNLLTVVGQKFRNETNRRIQMGGANAKGYNNVQTYYKYLREMKSNNSEKNTIPGSVSLPISVIDATETLTSDVEMKSLPDKQLSSNFQQNNPGMESSCILPDTENMSATTADENVLDADLTVDSEAVKTWNKNERVSKLSEAISTKAKLELSKRKEQLQQFENEKHTMEEELANIKTRINSAILEKDGKIVQHSEDMTVLLFKLADVENKMTGADEELQKINAKRRILIENIEQLAKQIEDLNFTKNELAKDHNNDIKALDEQSNRDKLVMKTLQLNLETLGSDIEQIINCDKLEFSTPSNSLAKETAAEYIALREQNIRLECLNKQIAATQKLLECPVCFETTEAPIFQCEEGHLICSSCKPKLRKCPECRLPYRRPDKRNRYAEKDAEKLQALIEERSRM